MDDTGRNTSKSKAEPGAFFNLNFEDLNQDFQMPPEFKKIKKLGEGAYGKVM